MIISSATLDQELLSNYFNTDIFKVSGRTFPVEIKYYPPENEKEQIIDSIEKILRKKLFKSKPLKEKYNGHVLVFVPKID